MSEPYAIDLQHVTRRFDTIVAVDDLTMRVATGSIYGLVGPDGAGKTTTLRLICGALAVDRGSIVVDGQDAVAAPARVQESIGYMPQRFSLYPDLTVLENLRFYAAIFGITPAEFALRSVRLLEDFSLTPFGNRLADALSGGMKQKLALACTLIHSPATIVLDEPTAGVDPVSRREFWRILYHINARGTTILVSTPYMDEAERCSRVAFMARGSLLAEGTARDLKSRLRGQIVEVTCSNYRGARAILRDNPAITSIEIFGGALHALVSSAKEAIPLLRDLLERKGFTEIRLREVPPSLEDVLVERMTA